MFVPSGTRVKTRSTFQREFWERNVSRQSRSELIELRYNTVPPECAIVLDVNSQCLSTANMMSTHWSAGMGPLITALVTSGHLVTKSDHKSMLITIRYYFRFEEVRIGICVF